jgi:transglutaminase-like putative cysteine protease
VVVGEKKRRFCHVTPKGFLEEQFMKTTKNGSKLFLVGMTAMLLAFGSVLNGCATMQVDKGSAETIVLKSTDLKAVGVEMGYTENRTPGMFTSSLIGFFPGGYPEYPRAKLYTFTTTIEGKKRDGIWLKSYAGSYSMEYIGLKPLQESAPEPQPQFVYHPTISSEELTKVELSYQSTIREIERQGRRIRIDSDSVRKTFIQKYQGNPDTTSVNNVKSTSIPVYSYNSTSEQQIVAMAKAEQNRFMKVRMIHDWVSDIFAYDFDYLEWMKYSNRNHEYTLGEIVEREKGVCLEYAILFYNLALAAGIDAYLISDHSGVKPNGEQIGHAYNMVMIDETGYVIDTTWDSGNQVEHNKYIAYDQMISKDYFMPSISESYKLRHW